MIEEGNQELTGKLMVTVLQFKLHLMHPLEKKEEKLAQTEWASHSRSTSIEMNTVKTYSEQVETY